MSILFSPIGESDPIRNYYDGPLLHILRTYTDISEVYAFMTKSIQKNKEILERGILETIKRDVKINYIDSEIEQANDYNIFYDKFAEIIRDIRSNHYNDEIYINISSGTPQMSVSLALIASQEKIGNLHTIQVSRPYEGIKDGPRVGTKDYNIEEEIFFNNDNTQKVNRCEEVKITTILYNNIREKILELIKYYEYSSALELLNSSPINNIDIQKLLNHLKFRVSQEYEKAIEFAHQTNYKNKLFLNVIVDKNKKSVTMLFETYLLMMNLYKTNKINDFLVRLCAYCEVLQNTLIENLYGYDVYEKFCNKKGKKYIVSKKKIQEYSEELMKKINNAFGGNYTEQVINFNVLNIIIKYEKQKKDTGLDLSFLDEISNLKYLRNEVAHTLKIATKKELMDKFKINEILYSIKNVLLKIAEEKNISSKYFSLYDDANKYIEEEMR